MWLKELWLSENDESNSGNYVSGDGETSAMIDSIGCPCSQQTGKTGHDEDRHDLALDLWCSVVGMESLNKRRGEDCHGVSCGAGENVTCGPDVVETVAQENLPFGKNSYGCCAGFDFGGNDFLLLLTEERC